MDMHRNPKYWVESSVGLWDLIEVENGKPFDKSMKIEADLGFVDNKYNENCNEKYITIGKGYP